MTPQDPRRESLRKVLEEPHTLQGAWIDQNPELVANWYDLLVETERERDEAIEQLFTSTDIVLRDGLAMKIVKLEGERDTALRDLAEARAECARLVATYESAEVSHEQQWLSKEEQRIAAKRECDTLALALRKVPMPIRESKLKGDDWHEAFESWWHAYASESAPARLSPAGGKDG